MLALSTSRLGIPGRVMHRKIFGGGLDLGIEVADRVHALYVFDTDLIHTMSIKIPPKHRPYQQG